VANHRAPRRSASRTGSTADVDVTPEALLPATTGAGKRRAEKPSRASRTLSRRAQTSPAPVPSPRGGHTGGRKALFPLLPSAPTAVGAAALVIAATGAITVTQPTEEVAAASPAAGFMPASAFTGVSAGTSSLALDSRTQAVSRDSDRTALGEAADEELQAAVEAQAEERSAALAQLAASAERYAGQIAANAWQLPLAGYRLTARFGYSSSLWASTHTGLDFAAPSGTPVVSVANGVVRSAGYDGAYGYKVVVAHEDGTETWYAHLSTITVAPGEDLTGGQQVGTVGSTGNSTGPHLHLEVRPGAGDPVDPYAALIARGVTP
jgi:murein DD-endopeptidase MepM/ murein hydrolase activator NlpD